LRREAKEPGVKPRVKKTDTIAFPHNHLPAPPDHPRKTPPEPKFPAGFCQMSQLSPLRLGGFYYFSELLTLVKTPFRFEPRPLTAAMMASAIPAAIKPYSIAVAPARYAKNLLRRFRKACLL
jgi:hypothetical protein